MKYFLIVATCVALVCTLYFSCDEEPDSAFVFEVEDFLLIAGEVSAQLSWTNPAASDFESVEIYYQKDGEGDYTHYVGSINPAKTIISPLDSECLYHVKIMCVYSNPDRVSIGIIKSVTVLHDDLPPDVTDISTIAGNNSITLMWSPPDIPDFDRVEITYGYIYGENTEVDPPLDSQGTIISSLLRDTEYSFNFRVYDTQGHESKGVSVSMSTLPYQMGDEGPAGGLIFYIDLASSHGFTYLEAAPLAWKGFSNPTSPWATATVSGGKINYSEIFVPGTTDFIYSGEENTMKIITAHPNPSNFPFAADRCVQLNFNGYTDWFLPSVEQLKAMYENLYSIPSPLGDFDDALYWSSLLVPSRDTYAKVLDFDGKVVREKHKATACTVRPVRAFSNYHTVATPVITTNPSGPYLPGTLYTITITCGTSNASLYYSINGESVTEDSNLYSAPFIYTTSAETGFPIQAKGFKDDYDSSSTVLKEMPIE